MWKKNKKKTCEGYVVIWMDAWPLCILAFVMSFWLLYPSS